MTHQPNELPQTDIIVDRSPQNGLFNMSMDAALLELAADAERTTVRIYQWSEPTMTLGHFQATASANQSPFPGLPTVRRLSGGGAILHDKEVTYSMVLPASHPARHNPSSIYEIVHRALIKLLMGLGFSCQLRTEYDRENPPLPQSTAGDQSSEPFLCFLRRNPNDIVHASGNKIVGSAQRRRKGVTLQHGSILLSSSTHAPGVLGISDLKKCFNMQEFQDALPLVVANSVGRILRFRDYDPTENDLAASIAAEMRLTCGGDIS